MVENNYGQIRWLVNQIGKCNGVSFSFIYEIVLEYYKDIIVLFSIYF